MPSDVAIPVQGAIESVSRVASSWLVPESEDVVGLALLKALDLPLKNTPVLD